MVRAVGTTVHFVNSAHVVWCPSQCVAVHISSSAVVILNQANKVQAGSYNVYSGPSSIGIPMYGRILETLAGIVVV